MKYFRKRRNMAVVMGRIAEIQLAALEVQPMFDPDRTTAPYFFYPHQPKS